MKVFDEHGGMIVSPQRTNIRNFVAGLDASKSASPSVGDVYIATDTDILYTCFTPGVWAQSTKIKNLFSGTDAAKPGTPAVGDVYVATDITTLYVCYVAENWTAVGGAAESAYFSKMVYYTMFDSLDFLFLANTTLDVDQGLKVERVGANAYADIRRNLDFTKNSKFASIVVFSTSGGSLAYVGTGGGPYAVQQHYGFRILGNALYASNADGVDLKQTEILGYTISSAHHYKAVFTAGSKIEFYVDDNLEVTHTDYLPTQNWGFTGKFMVNTIAGIEYVRWFAYEQEL